MNSLHKLPPTAAAAALARLFELGVLLTEVMDRGLGQQGLTRARGEVIWRLHHLGPVTQRALSEAMRCTPRNVTGLIDGLEATGHVGRRPHPRDRRAILVGLTDRGRATALAWQDAYQELADRALADLGEPDLTNLIAALDRILDRLRAAASVPSAAGHG